MSAINYDLYTPQTKAWKEAGGKVFGTICCYIPEEIIHAAGILPVRIRATGATEDSKGELYMSPFSCGFARACVEYLLDGKTYKFLDGLIGTNGCMQAQRVFDNSEYVDKSYLHYLFTTPRLVHERAFGFYRREMDMLRDVVEEFTGEKITDENLKASVELFNETRRLIKQLYELRKTDKPVITGSDTLKWTLAAMSMPKEDFNKQLQAFLEEAKDLPPLKGHDTRVMLVGSAVDDPDYVKNLEDQGCLVVTDVQCFGSRPYWEEIKTEGNIWDNIADMYLRRPACPRMTDTHPEIIKTIMDMAEEYKAEGVIYVRMKNCDPWGGESLFFRELMAQKDLPILELEKEEITSNAGQIAVRAGAFVEMLEDKE